jgi:hypothetical protein
MRYRLSRSAWVIALSLVAGISTTSAPQLLSLTIAAPKQPVKVGTEVRLRVTVRNTSHRTIRLVSLADSSYEYEIMVRDARGHVPPPSVRLRNRDKLLPRYSGSTFARDLQPGASYVDQIAITELYDLTKPGKYTVSVARQLNSNEAAILGTPPGKLSKSTATSNSVSVNVVR